MKDQDLCNLLLRHQGPIGQVEVCLEAAERLAVLSPEIKKLTRDEKISAHETPADYPALGVFGASPQVTDEQIYETFKTVTPGHVIPQWVVVKFGRAILAAAPQKPAQSLRGTSDQIKFERQITCEAIDGAIGFGMQGNNPPPFDDHWLAPYWKIGQQLAGIKAQEPAQPMTNGWSVTVEVDANTVLTISNQHVSGIPDIEVHADVIRMAAQNLLGFIGKSHQEPAQADAQAVHFFRQKVGGSWIESDQGEDPRGFLDSRVFEFRTLYTRPADSTSSRQAGYLEGLEEAAIPLDVDTILTTAWQFFSKKESPFSGGGTIVEGGVGSLVEFAHAIRALKAEVKS